VILYHGYIYIHTYIYIYHIYIYVEINNYVLWTINIPWILIQHIGYNHHGCIDILHIYGIK
jgi:hypothetical protein